MLKRYTPNSELIIFDENDGSLMVPDRDEDSADNQKSLSDIFLTRPLMWIGSNQHTQKIASRIIELLKKIGKQYYNLPYPVRRVTDGLMVRLVKKIRAIQYRNLENR